MSDKQRADHIQAKYWDGFLTRTEAQKALDDQAKVIQQLGIMLQKMDMVVSCLAEKAGMGLAEINAWITAKVAQAEQANTKPVEEPKVIVEA